MDCDTKIRDCGQTVEQESEARVGSIVEFANTGVGEQGKSPLSSHPGSNMGRALQRAAPSWELRQRSVLLRSLCGLRFEGTYVLIAAVEEFLQFPCRREQRVGNLDVFRLNPSICLAQLCLVFL